MLVFRVISNWFFLFRRWCAIIKLEHIRYMHIAPIFLRHSPSHTQFPPFRSRAHTQNRSDAINQESYIFHVCMCAAEEWWVGGSCLSSLVSLHQLIQQNRPQSIWRLTHTHQSPWNMGWVTDISLEHCAIRRAVIRQPQLLARRMYTIMYLEWTICDIVPFCLTDGNYWI